MSKFDGNTLVASDEPRLNRQLARVLEIMREGQWRTLRQIAVMADAPEASVSARLRDLRKPKFGGHNIQRMRSGNSALHFYRLGVAQ